jgi:hypothetical protein
MVFWNPDNPNCAATQVKGHLDAQLRSKLEFKIRDLSAKANTAEAKKAEEKERIKALEAKIGITLDEFFLISGFANLQDSALEPSISIFTLPSPKITPNDVFEGVDQE